MAFQDAHIGGLPRINHRNPLQLTLPFRGAVSGNAVDANAQTPFKGLFARDNLKSGH